MDNRYASSTMPSSFSLLAVLPSSTFRAALPFPSPQVQSTQILTLNSNFTTQETLLRLPCKGDTFKLLFALHDYATTSTRTRSELQ